MIFLIIPAAVSGVYGLYKGGKATLDRMDASSTNDGARGLLNRSTQLVDAHRLATNSVLEDFGSRKLRAFNGPIGDFIAAFGRLRNVEEMPSPELEKLKFGDFTLDSLVGLRNDYKLLMDSGLGLGAGLSGGAALAFGAYNGTMMLATASTGTAISTLSGAAATNATLAWLGGGSIAAGGGGMAMGAMVLGGVVAGPALAIFGHIFGSKADEALLNARTNMEVAKTHWETAQLTAQQLHAIEQVVVLANDTFSKITTHLRRSVRRLNTIVDSSGEDFRAYTQTDKELVFRAVKFAQLIKAMIDTPILDQAGALVLSTEKRVVELRLAADIKEAPPEANSRSPAVLTKDASDMPPMPAPQM